MPPSGKAFTFTTVGTVLVEWQGATRLGEIVQRYFQARRILLVTDPGLVSAGVLAPVGGRIAPQRLYGNPIRPGRRRPARRVGPACGGTGP
ncbi:Uncharacterised protein [Raoultella planticola]|uniref:Uncharacterized protein n=1 Tax=Raoultella planticola TaxID=575 RepID=A0A485AHP1_RAOPL|nr:Uncharacterised protein [Raoultella planticola]